MKKRLLPLIHYTNKILVRFYGSIIIWILSVVMIVFKRWTALRKLWYYLRENSIQQQWWQNVNRKTLNIKLNWSRIEFETNESSNSTKITRTSPNYSAIMSDSHDNLGQAIRLLEALVNGLDIALVTFGTGLNANVTARLTFIALHDVWDLKVNRSIYFQIIPKNKLFINIIQQNIKLDYIFDTDLIKIGIQIDKTNIKHVTLFISSKNN